MRWESTRRSLASWTVSCGVRPVRSGRDCPRPTRRHEHADRRGAARDPGGPLCRCRVAHGRIRDRRRAQCRDLHRDRRRGPVRRGARVRVRLERQLPVVGRRSRALALLLLLVLLGKGGKDAGRGAARDPGRPQRRRATSASDARSSARSCFRSRSCSSVSGCGARCSAGNGARCTTSPPGASSSTTGTRARARSASSCAPYQQTRRYDASRTQRKPRLPVLLSGSFALRAPTR